MRIAAPVLFCVCVLTLTGTLLSGMYCEPAPSQLSAGFRFSRAVSPIEFDPQAVGVRVNGELLVDSSDCRECHTTVYDNWYASRHRVAFTNELYQESHAREPSVWCVNCHAPFMRPEGDPEISQDRVQVADGISCMVCHVRDNRILTGSRPTPGLDAHGRLLNDIDEQVAREAGASMPTGVLAESDLQASNQTEDESRTYAHEYTVMPVMRSAEFCAECHQFNFLTADSTHTDFRYADLPMQSTYTEWKASDYFDRSTCQSCHLMRDTDDSHAFPGGHAVERLAAVLAVDALLLDEFPDNTSRLIELRVVTLGVGHAFPTGDLFRALKVRLYVPDGSLQREFYLHKLYRSLPVDQQTADRAARTLVRDQVIPPPVGDYASARTEVLDWPRRHLSSIRYELSIEYLDQSNRLTTRLPEDLTRAVIKSGALHIRN
ncbi:MAG: hypothetical protein KDK34_22710 [Leptospiraceae bacterium]|nr:hypothetical protein [Leptospiraceae bacterium]